MCTLSSIICGNAGDLPRSDCVQFHGKGLPRQSPFIGSIPSIGWGARFTHARVTDRRESCNSRPLRPVRYAAESCRRHGILTAGWRSLHEACSAEDKKASGRGAI